MDRFLSQWKRQASAPAGAGGLHLHPDGDDDPEEDDMADFIVDDEESDEEEADAAEADEEEHAHLQRSASVQLPKRIKLQVKSSSNKKSTSSKPRAVLDLISVTATPVAKRASVVQEKAKALFQRQLDKQRANPAQRPSPPPAAAAAAASAAAAAGSSAAAVVTAVPAAASATPPGTAALSTLPVRSKSLPAAAATPLASVARKRKHLVLDDDDEEAAMQRLIDSIEDSPDDEEVRGMTRAEMSEAAEREAAKVNMGRNRNVVGLMHAVASGSLPFQSQQLARISKLQREYASSTRSSAHTSANGDDAVSLQTVGAASSSAVAAGGSSRNGVSVASYLPAYATSPFARAHVLHHELLHHSMRHLLWSGMKPVLDWSLAGPSDQFGRAPHEQPPMQQQMQMAAGAAEISYINSIEFDATGSLLSATSNNAVLSLYDFDCVWMAGRRVENVKRSRALDYRLQRDRESEYARTRSDSPPRSRLGWQLNQPPPALNAPRPPPPPAPHELLRPIFTMDLQASSRARMANREPPLPPLHTLKQIDTQRWNPYNSNELALSSRKNNQIFIFDVSRCDEQGSPHRRVLARDVSSAPLHSSSVMDFRYFPSTSPSHGNSQTLVAALRNGDINVLDLRVRPGAASGDAMAQATQAKVYKPQQRADMAARAAAISIANPPASMQLSACGHKLYVFTELGTLECWDTRLMRAGFDRVMLLETMWNASNTAGSSGASGSPSSSSSSSSSAAASSLLPPPSLGLHLRNSWSRVCSSDLHPQDDHCLLFQLVSGAVGLLDLNPCSPSFKRCDTVVPFAADFVTAQMDDFSLRHRKVATFMPNGQVGSTASAGREKTMAVCNLQHEIQFIESCASPSCASPPRDIRLPPFAAASDPMLQRELQRSADHAHATSSRMHVLCTLPAASTSDHPDIAAIQQSNPVMALAAHPNVPYVLAGYKQQRIRIITHQSELEAEMERINIADE